MKIMMKDRRVFQGTPAQIVGDMKGIAFGVESLTLSQYIDWVVGNTLRIEEVRLSIPDGSDDERAAKLVEEMVRTQLASRI